jgi:hypothetical protein
MLHPNVLASSAKSGAPQPRPRLRKPALGTSRGMNINMAASAGGTPAGQVVGARMPSFVGYYIRQRTKQKGKLHLSFTTAHVPASQELANGKGKALLGGVMAGKVMEARQHVQSM